MKKLWLAIPILLFGLVLSIFLGGLIHQQTARVQHSDKMVPAFSLKVMGSDATFANADLSGDPRYTHTLVNFFASWCAPCAVEIDFLKTVQVPHMRMLGIAYKDKPEKTEKFLKDNGNPYALVAMDPDGMGAINWGLTGVPETFLLDTQGRILAHHAGPITAENWESIFKPKLGEP
jgi:cytochrome c biogenesis protein CcmG/thiol:disulfide interchange protein DsbE